MVGGNSSIFDCSDSTRKFGIAVFKVHHLGENE